MKPISKSELVPSKKELNVTGKPSSLDSVLLKMLDLAAQITRQEIQPGEANFWKEAFRGESPERVEAAFKQYLKTADYFPKPGNIREILDRQDDIWNKLKALGEQHASHGCESGWVRVQGGVIRCKKCVVRNVKNG